MNEHHNSAQRTYFRSADQPTILPIETPYVIKHVEQLVTCGRLVQGEKVLEVGAGIGRFSPLLLSKGLEVTASDISPELIAVFQQSFPEISAFVGDVNTLSNHHHNKYDAVVGFFMLHHLPDLKRAFQGIKTMLTPRGKMVFCEPNAWFFPFYLQILLTPRMRWSIDRGVINMRQSILTLALKNNGFQHIEYHYYGLLPPQLYNHFIGKKIDRGIEKLPIPARMRAFQIITASL